MMIKMENCGVPSAGASVKKVVTEAKDREKVAANAAKLPFRLPIRTKKDALEANDILSEEIQKVKVLTWLAELCEAEHQHNPKTNFNALIANALIGAFDGSFLFICEFTGKALTITNLREFVLNQTHKLPLSKVPKIRELHELALQYCRKRGFLAKKKRTEECVWPTIHLVDILGDGVCFSHFHLLQRGGWYKGR